MKQKGILIAAALLLLTVTAAHASQASDPQLIARQYIPQDAVFQRTERDDGLTEYQFRSPDDAVEYDVTLHPETQAVVKVEYDVRNDRGSATVVLSEQQASEKVLELYPDASVISVMLERDDGLQKYEIHFSTDTFAGRMKLNPETGEVLDRELDYTRVAEGFAAGPLSAAEAKELALGKVTNGRIISFEEEYDDGRRVYEGEIISGQSEYDFEIDAETGVFTKWELDD